MSAIITYTKIVSYADMLGFTASSGAMLLGNFPRGQFPLIMTALNTQGFSAAIGTITGLSVGLRVSPTGVNLIAALTSMQGLGQIASRGPSHNGFLSYPYYHDAYQLYLFFTKTGTAEWVDFEAGQLWIDILMHRRGSAVYL